MTEPPNTKHSDSEAVVRGEIVSEEYVQRLKQRATPSVEAAPWREIGGPLFERIGAACDRIAAAGYPDLARALAGHTRERRGTIGRLQWPSDQSRHIIRLADESERLATVLEEGRGS